jgi:hypothetical protein
MMFVAVPAHADSKVLGKAPMCEASAALRLSCGEGDCLFVGDNEVQDRLYQFSITNQDLQPQGSTELLLGDVEVSDIESLVNLGSNRILVLGSHSRNKVCDPKKKRRRFVIVERSEDGIEPVAQTVQAEKIKCERLLGNTADDSPILSAVCKAIDATEEQADSIFHALDTMGQDATEEACGKAAPFNIEGAVAIPAAGGPEVWIGLRGPLVRMEENGEGPQLAVMLRMKNQQKLSFDTAALVNLGGFAMRELTVAGGWVWGIAGPPEDSSVAFKLWRFPIRSLEANAIIEPESLGELPTSSEGLALSGSTAFVVIDGEQSGNSCGDPARYQVVRVSNY